MLSLFLVSTGWMDLDWMFVQGKFQQGQGAMTAVNWEFSPYLTVNWWLAYQLSIYRIMAGMFILGICLTALPVLFKESYISKKDILRE